MLNDQTKDYIPPIESDGKNEGAKITESAGNFSNNLQNQQGAILAAYILGAGKKKSFWVNFAMKFAEMAFKIGKPLIYPIARILCILGKGGSEGEFSTYNKGSAQAICGHAAKTWAKKVGASAEETREFADKQVKQLEIMHYYNGNLTRNEFVKKYPHLKGVAQAADDEVQEIRRQSLKGTVKDIRMSRIAKKLRQHRETNRFEADIFSKHLDKYLGLDAAKYQVNIYDSSIHKTLGNTHLLKSFSALRQ